MNFSRLYLIPIASFTILVVMFVAFPFDYAWFVILPVVGLISLLSNWLIPFLWIKRVPGAARQLVKAWQNKLVPAFIAHDSGRAAIVNIIEKRGEGVVVTDHGNYRLLPRFVKVEEGDVATEEPVRKKKGRKKPNPGSAATAGLPQSTTRPRYVLDYNTDWVNKRSILIGLGSPFYVGYSGKLCLLNPECLAWFEAGEIWIPDTVNPPKDKKDLPKPLMLLNVLKMKDIINRRFDSSQIKALAKYAEEIGSIGRGLSPTMKLFLGLGVIAVLAIVALYVLPGMTGR